MKQKKREKKNAWHLRKNEVIVDLLGDFTHHLTGHPR
jgi:hypothetical protein